MPLEPRFDLSAAKETALAAAREWELALGEPFGFSSVSYVVPAGCAVLKVAWEGDDESLHEGDALELWDGDGAVRLLRRSGRALLEERASPGDDLSALPDDEATAIAVDVASRLWRRAGLPFRPVAPEVPRWLDRAEREGASSFRSRASCLRGSTRGRTGSCMAISTTTTFFAAAIGSSRSIRSRTWLIASTICPRSSEPIRQPNGGSRADRAAASRRSSP